MKKVFILAIGVLILSMAITGVAISEEKMASESQISIAGTVNANNQLIDEKGQAFNLADTDKGMQVKAMVGKRIQIKGTLLEEEGKSVVRVSDYQILRPKAPE